MLINLYTEMKKKHLTQKEIAQKLGMNEKTFGAKINGRISFTVDELLELKREFFPDSSLEYLAKKVTK